MQSTLGPAKELRFGPFELDFEGERLRRNGTGVKLQDQPLKLLCLLVERQGEVVSRNEMRMRLWPAESFGDFDNGLNVAIKKLRTALGDDPDRPSYIETIPRKGYRFIAPTYEEFLRQTNIPSDKHPANYISNASENPTRVAESALVSSTLTPGRHFSIRRSRWMVSGLILATACLIVLKGHIRDSTDSFRRELKIPAARRAVAVLDLRNASGRADDAWLSTALSEMLRTELAAGDRLRLVPGEEAIQAHEGLASGSEASPSRNEARQLRRALAADLVVTGSFATISGDAERQVRVDVRIQDTASGEIVSQISESGAEPGLFGIIGKVGERLRKDLGITSVSADQHTRVLASMPAMRDAGKDYSMGLAKLRVEDPLHAVELLERAIDAEPTFPLAHSALSEAWAKLGYEQRSLDEAQKADQLSSGLPSSEQLLVQAHFLEASREWDRAADAYRSLHLSFPDEPDYGLHFAHDLVRAGKGQEAAIVLDSLRSLQQSDLIKAKLDLGLAEAYTSMGSMDRALSAAQNSVGEARNQARPSLLAKALRTQGMACENLGQYDGAMSAVNEAETFYRQAGDQFGVASVLEVQGNIFSDIGQYAEALARYQEELATVRAIGYKRGEASALNNAALVLYRTGDLNSSRAMMEMALAAFIELPDKSNEAIVRVNIGGILKDQGSLSAADQQYNTALSVSRQIHDAGGTVLALHGLSIVSDARADYAKARRLLHEAIDLERANGLAAPSSESLLDLGDIQRHQGDLNGARKSYNDALASSRKSGEKEWTAYALFGLGKIAVLSGDFAEARADYDQSLKLRNELGEALAVAETKLAIAEETIKEGQSSDVVHTLQSLRDQFDTAGRQAEWIAAGLLISEARILEGKIQEASNELDQLPASSAIEAAETRWDVGIVRGRVQSAQGKLTEARRTLSSVLRESSRLGSQRDIFEARLRLATGQTNHDSRQKELDRVCREATRQGYKILALEVREGNL
jgi:DNA-binding winged helix-turn-helix (wHTH) protein/tetratricopeptide (TPR) repeat protein/TolB-like protein